MIIWLFEYQNILKMAENWLKTDVFGEIFAQSASSLFHWIDLKKLSRLKKKRVNRTFERKVMAVQSFSPSLVLKTNPIFSSVTRLFHPFIGPRLSILTSTTNLTAHLQKTD